MSLDEKLLYIEKWGVNQFESCDECQKSNLATRCFVAARIGPECGNCLHAGKQCHFPTADMLDSSEEENTRESVIIVQEDDVVIRRKRTHQVLSCFHN
jgi:hypothetical protein